jgi:hypothetical protein
MVHVLRFVIATIQARITCVKLFVKISVVPETLDLSQFFDAPPSLLLRLFPLHCMFATFATLSKKLVSARQRRRRSPARKRSERKEATVKPELEAAEKEANFWTTSRP